MRKSNLRTLYVMFAIGILAFMNGSYAAPDTLGGIKTRADIDDIAAKILSGNLKGTQSFFEIENGPYRIYTSFINNRKGAADIHVADDEIFLVLSGSAELTLGGDIVDKKATAENEFRGTAIAGGTIHSVGTGDMISIPRGTAHQFDPGTGHILYMVIKIIGCR